MAETPILQCFSKNANFKKKHKKEKKDTICEHTCANCSCQNVLFSAFFIFGFFCNLQNFQRCFLIGSQNSNNYKIWKQRSKHNNNKRTRYKARINQPWWFKAKQDNKQKNKSKITSWTKTQTKQKEKAKTRNRNEKQEGRKKEKNKKETKKEKGEEGGCPRKAKEKQRETQINKQKLPF